VVVQLPDKITQQFFDIINQEDWDLDEIELPTIQRDMMSGNDIPLGNMFLPTPIPGVWINILLGFEIENPEDYG